MGNKSLKKISSTLERLAATFEKYKRRSASFDVEAIADFMENGFEHESHPDVYLQHHFGMKPDTAKLLVSEWQKTMIGPKRPAHLHSEENLISWIKNVIAK